MVFFKYRGPYWQWSCGADAVMLSPVDDAMVTAREYLLIQATMPKKKKPGNDLKPALIILRALQGSARGIYFRRLPGSTLRCKPQWRALKENKGSRSLIGSHLLIDGFSGLFQVALRVLTIVKNADDVNAPGCYAVI